jgi:hypothetical protein
MLIEKKNGIAIIKAQKIHNFAEGFGLMILFRIGD